MIPPSAERVRELFVYDPISGDLTWRRSQGRAKAGARVGCVNRKGYRALSVDGTSCTAHQVIWLYATGDWPPLIDHLNGVRDDNRWKNLRLADRASNARNRTNWRHSKLLGAHARNGKWEARISSDGMSYYLGRFETEEQAHERYLSARQAIEQAEKAARQEVLSRMVALKAAA